MNHLLALALATAVLVAIPGPNVALTVANSLRYGFAAGAATVAGAVAGVGLQLLLVVLGLAAVVELAGSALVWVKWAGVVYLVLLGIRTFRQPAGDIGSVQARPAVFAHALAIAVVNPKTLLFNAAFLPQFLAPDAGVAALLAAACVYLAVIFAGDLCWALGASRARGLLQRYGRLKNRLSGAFLVAAGVGLAFAKR